MLERAERKAACRVAVTIGEGMLAMSDRYDQGGLWVSEILKLERVGLSERCTCSK